MESSEQAYATAAFETKMHLKGKPNLSNFTFAERKQREDMVGAKFCGIIDGLIRTPTFCESQVEIKCKTFLSESRVNFFSGTLPPIQFGCESKFIMLLLYASATLSYPAHALAIVRGN